MSSPLKTTLPLGDHVAGPAHDHVAAASTCPSRSGPSARGSRPGARPGRCRAGSPCPRRVACRSRTSSVARRALPFVTHRRHTSIKTSSPSTVTGKMSTGWVAGRVSRLARVQVERRPVLRALDRLEVDVDLALVQVVRARASRSRRRARNPSSPRFTTATQAPSTAKRRASPARHVGRRRTRGRAPSAHALGPARRAIAASAPSRTSSICTRSSTSWKNPVTISRSASSRGMPRLCEVEDASRRRRARRWPRGRTSRRSPRSRGSGSRRPSRAR